MAKDINTIYTALKQLFRKKGEHKMKALCIHCGLIEEGESASSADSAKVRLQLGKLIEEGKVVKTGDKATTRYSKA